MLVWTVSERRSEVEEVGPTKGPEDLPERRGDDRRTSVERGLVGVPRNSGHLVSYHKGDDFWKVYEGLLEPSFTFLSHRVGKEVKYGVMGKGQGQRGRKDTGIACRRNGPDKEVCRHRKRARGRTS